MRKISLHPSAQLAWAIANTEACLSVSAHIEPLHLFLAILKIVDEIFYEAAEKLNLSVDTVSQLTKMAAEGRRLIGMPTEEITRLRRSIQKALQPEATERPLRMLHRSPRCRDLFSQGARLAVEDQASALTFLHLLNATLLDPPPDIAKYLPAREAQKPALAWETRINEFVQRFKLTRITLVLTDMVDSMAIKRRYGDLESAKIFRAHDHLIREDLARVQEAREIKTIGDSFLLAFGSEEAAVRFALVVQFRLRNDRQLSRIPLKLRMGIYAGEILSKVIKDSRLSDPIFGITIDTTSRIASLATGDQVLTDRKVYEKTSAAIASNPLPGLQPVEWRCHGSYQLKGLESPVEIYEVGEIGKAAFVKPKASEKAAPAAAGPVAERTHPATPYLNRFSRDLTALAREGRLATVVGRSKEIKMLARYLQRTSKRNVIVIGDAGVGKTALVEGLAQQIVSKSAPDFLRALRIVQLTVADLIAGAKYRGDMEARIQRILQEAMADPYLVLFLDEIHLVMKSGGGEAPMDIANILKPALVGEDFRCIGATTTEEFERYIKNDTAFMRRFQVLRVGEPSQEHTLLICHEWARRIERIQEVIIEDVAIEAAVTLSARLIRERSLPDKAIDLLENAAAFVKVSSLTFRNRVPTKEPPRIGRQEIEVVLEEQYGISASASGALDTAKVESVLRAELVGQDEAITALVEALAALGTKKDDAPRPLGVFMFTGPTGIGKTFVAECIGRALFGADGRALGRFNMSEYKERHELARLIGAPPGFVGHEQQGAIFRFVETNPQGLILLDEMEKAHPEIQDYFLQIFDKGEATDSRGRTAHFRRHLFVMTCNVVAVGNTKPKIGFHAGEEKLPADQSKAVDVQLSQHFRREFLARVDRIIAFHSLTADDYRILLDRRLVAFAEQVEQQHETRLEITDAAKQPLCALCADQEEGARGFIRLFERIFVAALFDHIKTGPKQGVIRVGWGESRPVFS